MPPVIGYEYPLSCDPLRMPPLGRPAQVRPVTRVERMPDLLAVPRHVAPAAGNARMMHLSTGTDDHVPSFCRACNVLDQAQFLSLAWYRFGK